MCIQSIWDQYDNDNSGYLDREEAKRFVMESIKGQNQDTPLGKKMTLQQREKKEEEDELNEQQFEACFTAVDDDNNGSISRDEMLQFIKLVSDIDEFY